ncbi:ATP-binding cassette domain-containing protein [Streptomyces bambusae]|uniref:ATP-binding cassette domain-containing protein n=1 Tax=Streptomyces bambusae TaxID=1550616 RepID=UPI002155F500|nr:ATP-binding cassette domain-containing protein [Streptomyces bambusae]
MRTLSAATQIVLSEVTKRYDTHVVLDRVSCTVRPGERVGVVGGNGSGKSTLLRLLAGHEAPDDGTVAVLAPGGTGHLAQTLDLPPAARVGDAIDLALAEIRVLERRIRAAEAGLDRAGPDELTAYDGLLAAYETRGGHDADRRVATTLRRLGERAPLDPDRRLGTLSGGQRSRLALAAVLAAEPELLLLDEPTNDLDDEAVAWLEEHLASRRGTLVAVTHDRLFLDRVTTTVLEVDHDRRALRRYGNGYAGYLTALAAERTRWAREYEEWCAERRRAARLAASNSGNLAAIPRKVPRGFSGAGAFRARSRAHGAMGRIRNARERLERLDRNPVPPPPVPLRFTGRFTAAGPGPDGGGPARDGRGLPCGAGPAEVPSAGAVQVEVEVEVEGLAVSGRLAPVSFRLAPGDRLLVTGPNGAGKTTLLRLLAGERIDGAQGSLRLPARVGLFRQDDLRYDEPRTVREVFGPERAELLTGLGLLGAGDLGRSVRALSAGQRRKLDLADLVAEPLDLLLLDEPTNHLAPSVVEDLEAALAHYTGALVLVTHDRRLRSAFTGRHLELTPAAYEAPAVSR